MKRKIFITAMLALVGVVVAQAQILWRVQTPDRKNTSYVLGTCHVISSDHLDQIKGFDQAMAECKQMYMEANVEDTLALLRASFMMFNTVSDSVLSKICTPEELKRVDGILSKLADDVEDTGDTDITEFLDGFTPAGMTFVLSQMMWEKYLPEMAAIEKMDVGAMRRMVKAGKEVHYLETAEEQMQYVLSGTYLEQKARLMSFCNEFEANKLESQVKDIIAAYREGNLEVLARLMNDSESQADRQWMKHIIVDRNHNWMKKLTVSMAQQPTLVCVGAGHLTGDEGLLKLLSKAGFIVTPVDK